MKRFTMINPAFHRNNRGRSWTGLLILIVLCHISILGWAWGDSLASKNNEGNKLYKNGRIDEALSKWRDAQIENPDSDKLHYNIGNGFHEQKKYEDAFKEYEKSLNSKDSELQRKAYYNMGNTHYRMGKFLEAIEEYKKCLDINPDDEDAKYNIEFVRKKIEENLKKEDKEQKESQQKGENKDVSGNPSTSLGTGKSEVTSKEEKVSGEEQEQSEEQKSGETGEKEKEKKSSLEEEQQKEQKQLGSEKKESQTKKEQQEFSGKEEKGEMSKEDAVRLLDALKGEEKDIQKELKNQPIEGRYRVDKDW